MVCAVYLNAGLNLLNVIVYDSRMGFNYILSHLTKSVALLFRSLGH